MNESSEKSGERRRSAPSTLSQGESDAQAAAPEYRLPAEWSQHQATWLSWPHNAETWPGCLPAVERMMASAVAALTEGEDVHINVLDGDHAEHVLALLGTSCKAGRVYLHEVPTNDAWCRDHGAIFLNGNGISTQGQLALNFRFNAWGGKYPPFDLDDAVPRHMARLLNTPIREVDVVLEGGSIDSNGAGALLTTEQCLLHPNRNPGFDRAAIESMLCGALGVQQIIWLGDGIVGDDTDGHVDDITRFVATNRVLTMVEPNRNDPNHAPLAENLRRLRDVRLADGQPLELIELAMPKPLLHNGERLPASYANFYIGNRVVLLPVFDDPGDSIAIETLQQCFPTRKVVPLDSREVVIGLGAWHCLTQQVPVF